MRKAGRKRSAQADRQQQAAPVPASPAPLSSSSSSASSSKRLHTAAPSSAASSAALSESLDSLRFEDEWEDDWDDEEQQLKERITRREMRKRESRRSSPTSAAAAAAASSRQQGGVRQQQQQQEAEQGGADGQQEDGDDSDDDGDSDDGDDELDAAADEAAVRAHDRQRAGGKVVWRPSPGAAAAAGELEYDSSAYAMLHRLQVEWPCLSFDVVPDSIGAHRVRFPHSLYLVTGSQADSSARNQLTLIKVKDLHKTKHDADSSDDEDEDEDAQQQRPGAVTLSEGGQEDDSSGSEDALDDEPLVSARSVPHLGSVNRVKVCPLAPQLVAAMSDAGTAAVFDLGFHLSALDTPPATLRSPQGDAPLFTFRGHATEGYALAWSPLLAGRLVSGDCAGGLYLWEGGEAGAGWTVDGRSFRGHSGSVEDLCWSPGEDSVFCSVSSDRTARMWDVRLRERCAAFVAAHKADVNVCSWNCLRQHLLATGSDDGSFKVWDLRMFRSSSPAATFAFHERPITSIEWQPHEDSVLAAASDDHSLTVWDLSLETDDDELRRFSTGAALPEDEAQRLPPQLFFQHAGQTDIKELHWHRQIPGCLLSTARHGVDIFIADNMRPA